MMTDRDIRNGMKEARAEGLAEGIAQGEANGLAKGKAEMARAMKADGMSLEMIAK